MGQFATAIPEKIFFKIGEVCDLVGVQAHVLRYWETEFPMLSPQKNRSGQRSYRRRDVEIALRVKELLYEDLYTIAGAKKKLQVELRETNRLKIVHSDSQQQQPAKESFIKEVKIAEPQIEEFAAEDALEDNAIEKFDDIEDIQSSVAAPPVEMNEEQREALNNLAAQLLELREMLKTKKPEEQTERERNYRV
ncbi:MAG: MerR family transcriptional regulator [Acidobacteria bacterium]|jgi:DNA-binding transcriptional MerR regulator|nr:MerR family transcriptional regulator [Acidobacteriota bacterium]